MCGGLCAQSSVFDFHCASAANQSVKEAGDRRFELKAKNLSFLVLLGVLFQGHFCAVLDFTMLNQAQEVLALLTASKTPPDLLFGQVVFCGSMPI